MNLRIRPKEIIGLKDKRILSGLDKGNIIISLTGKADAHTTATFSFSADRVYGYNYI